MVPTDRAVVLPSPSRLLGQTSDCLGSEFILCAMADQSSYLSGMRGGLLRVTAQGLHEQVILERS